MWYLLFEFTKKNKIRKFVGMYSSKSVAEDVAKAKSTVVGKKPCFEIMVCNECIWMDVNL